MKDKRPVGELSVEELERILAIRRREERLNRLRHMREDGRRVNIPPPDEHGNGEHTKLPTSRSDTVQLSQHERAATVPAPVEPTTYDLTEDVPHFEGDLPATPHPVPAGDRTALVEDGPPRFVDETPPQTIHLPDDRATTSQTTLKKKALNWLLLVVEVLFVSALAIVVYRGFTGLQNIQETTSRTQQELNAAIERGRVTPSPTPILSAANYLLPGGHTPPDENGFSVFNLEELERNVPESVRPAVRREMLDPPAVEQRDLPNDPVAVDIPAIGISSASVVTGDHWDALKAGIGHRSDSGRPGTNQNVVLTGHNDIYGEIFRDLPELKVGDEIRIRDASGRIHLYRVREAMQVEPTDVWVLNPNLGPQVTLITCYPYKVDTHRWIVFADLVE